MVNRVEKCKIAIGYMVLGVFFPLCFPTFSKFYTKILNDLQHRNGRIHHGELRILYIYITLHLFWF